MASRHRDRLPGGLADKSKPTDFDPEQLRMGIEVEMEHTASRKVAREIAMDHLKEDPRYYTKLKRVHKESLDMNLQETLRWLSDIRESLDEAVPVRATGKTRGYLPGVTDTSKKPPPVKAAARRAAGKKPLPTRRGAQPPKAVLGNKKGDETAQALAGLKKMNRSETDKALDHIRDMNKKTESVIATIRSLIEGEEREGGGSKLNSRERLAKGLRKVNQMRRLAPPKSKGGLKKPKLKKMPGAQ